MSKTELVSSQIYKELMDNYFVDQLDDLENLELDALDSSYLKFFEFYRSISDVERKNVSNIIKQIVIDTASTVLGGIDEVTDLGTLTESFELKYGDEIVSGDLQDYFLMIHQEDEGE